jgi:hypothetical protein
MRLSLASARGDSTRDLSAAPDEYGRLGFSSLLRATALHFLAVCGLAASSLGAPAQVRYAQATSISSAIPNSDRQTFTGMAVLPSGLPASGSIVFTSAGGNAVCLENGSFSVTAEVPFGAEWVDVTVITPSTNGADASLTASVVVRPGFPQGTTDVGLVELSSDGSCSPAWIQEFGGQPGTTGFFQALAVYNDGGGSALYVGGQFASIGGIEASAVAKWDGTAWTTLGSGLTGFIPAVTSMIVFDDGGGPELYVAGVFTAAGGTSANSIAKWDGASWSAVGSGVSGIVSSMAVFDDGGGSELYVGGQFLSAGGGSANNIAKWDGSTWSALGSGMSGGGTTGVFSLAVFDDGGGDALYAGGQFTSAGGTSANRVARWDGSSWSALGTGMNARVNALLVHDDGSGDALYAGGEFTSAGGGAANFIAEWNGSSWTALGSGMSGDLTRVLALGAYDDGGGGELYAGGDFTSAGGVSANEIAKWDGSSWSAVGGGVEGPGPTADIVSALVVFDDGGGGELFVGGSFKTVGSTLPAHSIASWNGSAWSATGVGMTDQVLSLTVFDDGTGRALYAGGAFIFAGTTAANRVSKWNGSSWSSLGSGLDDVVYSLTVYDDGGGPAFYAGGEFTTAGGTSANGIAMWDGTNWSALGSGVNGTVFTLKVFDDGGGPELYAAGNFTTAGGSSANRIAKWDGSSWSSVGSGMNSSVFALGVYNDGGGDGLYAGGNFTTAGGGSASRIAKWDGSSWSSLGSGIGGGVLTSVYSITPFRDGAGVSLGVGGDFTIAGGGSANAVAKWNGSSWSSLSTGMNDVVFALGVFDDGSGGALYAGGSFTIAGGGAANSIAKWNGSSWSALDGGVTVPLSGESGVRAMVSFTISSVRYLFVGGAFTASPGGDSFIAQWGGC